MVLAERIAIYMIEKRDMYRLNGKASFWRNCKEILMFVFSIGKRKKRHSNKIDL